MKRQEYLIHLISEVASFILQGDPRKLVISLHQEEDGVHFAAIDDRQRSDSEIRQIEHTLNAARRPELVGYYGSMVGHDLLGSARLNLVGWQIKHADVARTPEGGMMLNIWVGGEGFDFDKFSIDAPDAAKV